MLDPFTEVVPSRPTLTVPELDRVGRPAFPVRASFTGLPYGYPAQAGRLNGGGYSTWGPLLQN